MTTPNPYRPPAAALADNARVAGPATWMARILAAVCIVTGIVGIMGIAVMVVGSGISMAALYVLCAGPMLWCLLGYLILVRSRYAWPASIVAIVVPYLLGPLASRLVQADLAMSGSHFDYWHAVRAQVQATGLDGLLFAAVLLYTGWDYRERFAAWRRE